MRYSSIGLLLFLVILSDASFSQTVVFSDDFETDPIKSPYPYKWRQLTEKDNVKGSQYASFNSVKYHPEVIEAVAPKEEIHSGKRSCRFYVWGKDMAIETRDFIPINHSRKYELKGWVKTKNVKFNKFYFSIIWFDKFGSPIRLDKSLPIYGENDWTEVKTEFSIIPQEAQYAKIRCNYEGGDTYTICFIDDISFIEYIKLDVKPSKFGGIFGSDEYIEYDIFCSQMEPGKYNLVCSIKNYRDENQKEYIEKRLSAERDKFDWKYFFWEKEAQIKKKGVFREKFSLPPILDKGYYELELLLSKENKLIIRTLKKFVVIERKKGIPMPVEWFGTTVSPEVFYSDALADALENLDAGVCRIVWWDIRSEFKEPLSEDTWKKFFIMLRSKGIMIKGILKDNPVAYTVFKANSLAEYFSQDKEIWKNSFEQFLNQRKIYVRNIQIGFDDDESFGRLTISGLENISKNLREIADNVSRGILLGLPIDSTQLRVSNQIDFLRNAKERKIDFVTINFSKSKTHKDIENSLPEISTLKNLYKLNASVELSDCPARENFVSLQRRNGELVKKLVILKSSDLVDEIYVYPFFDDARNSIIHPEENTTSTYPVLKNLVDKIGKRRFTAKDFFLNKGVASYVFEGFVDDVIVVWTEGTVDSDFVELFGGRNVKVVDIIGNDISNKVLEYENQYKCRVLVSDVPVFIVNVDKDLIRFQLDVKLLREELEPSKDDPKTMIKRLVPDNTFSISDKKQEKIISFYGNYPERIEIKHLRIIFPKGWRGDFFPKPPQTIERGEEFLCKTNVFVPRDFFLKYEEGIYQEKIGIEIKFVTNRKTEEVVIWKRIILTRGIEVEVIRHSKEGNYFIADVEIRNKSERNMQVYGYFTLKNKGVLISGPHKNWIRIKKYDKAVHKFKINLEGKDVDEFIILLKDEYGDAFLNTRVKI